MKGLEWEVSEWPWCGWGKGRGFVESNLSWEIRIKDSLLLLGGEGRGRERTLRQHEAGREGR